MSVVLSPDNVERIVRALQRVEGWPVNDPAVPPHNTRSSTDWTALFQVTSLTQTNGWYPGNWQTFDPDTLVKAAGGPEAGWIRGPNNETLELNKYYVARLMGTLQADGKAAWMTESAGMSGSGITVEYDDASLVINPCNIVELHKADFVLTNPSTATALITTNGFTGTVGPFYKYTCTSGNLTQFSSTGFSCTDGLVQGNIGAYS
jgi:hypothetical protein